MGRLCVIKTNVGKRNGGRSNKYGYKLLAIRMRQNNKEAIERERDTVKQWM